MQKTYYKNRDYVGLVSQIGRKIATSGWRPDYVVGITRGGLYPALLLSHYLDVPMQTLSVQLRDSTMGPESNLWMAEDAFEGKNILIVDDINDSGETINWIQEDWASSCHPHSPQWQTVWGNNVKIAVLVDNLSSNAKTTPSYVGLEVNKAENDVWIDFPWEDWWAK